MCINGIVEDVVVDRIPWTTSSPAFHNNANLVFSKRVRANSIRGNPVPRQSDSLSIAANVIPFEKIIGCDTA